jgi:hypothetical protein
MFSETVSSITLKEWRELRGTLRGHQIRIHELNFDRCESSKEVVNLLANAANAPEYFGGTLDSIVDVLADRPPGTDLFILQNIDRLPTSVGIALRRVIDAATQDPQYGLGRAKFLIVSDVD